MAATDGKKEDDGGVRKYVVAVHTGEKSSSGTDGNVTVKVYGEEGKKEKVTLSNKKGTDSTHVLVVDCMCLPLFMCVPRTQIQRGQC